MLQFFFHRKVGYYPPNKKFFDNFAITCDFKNQKAIWFKKMHFLARKWCFFKKKNFIQIWSGIKTTSCAHTKKYIFKIKLWPCNFHQILPTYEFKQVVSWCLSVKILYCQLKNLHWFSQLNQCQNWSPLLPTRQVEVRRCGRGSLKVLTICGIFGGWNLDSDSQKVKM